MMLLHRQLATTYHQMAAVDGSVFLSRSQEASDEVYTMVTNICQSVGRLLGSASSSHGRSGGLISILV
jgi:hypothetical protein